MKTWKHRKPPYNPSLKHYRESPIDFPLKPLIPQKNLLKPRGFWVSVEGEGNYNWKDWCEDNEFALDRLETVYTVDLVTDPNLKIISSVEEIDLFHEEYKTPFDPQFNFDCYKINWDQVAKEYKGIIIAPYISKRRLSGAAHSWYYGWDCASGCIWDTSAIDKINLINN